MKVAEGAFYLEAVPANGIAMRAARHERHIMSSRGHPAAEITSHGTRCHDRNPHLAPPRPKYSFRAKLARWKAPLEQTAMARMMTPVRRTSERTTISRTAQFR
jgi:hypothetical protein